MTGHTGFKGAWLTLWLERLGARVTGYAHAPATRPDLFAAAGCAEGLVAHHEADVRDGDRLAVAVAAADPDVIFHLAAQPLVRAAYREPRLTFETNVLGTCNLLECVRLRGRPCAVVVVTSDKCYENGEQDRSFHETDPMGGADPYSASKGAAELVVASYRRSFFGPQSLARHGIKLASVRAGNVIGGGDWSRDRIVPDAVRALAAGEPVPVRNPRAVRPWQHVLEPLSGYLALAARLLASDEPRWCDGWNFGPGPDGECPVSELVERLCRAWGGGTWRDAGDAAAPHEARVLRLSIDKAFRELGWRPRWGLDTLVGHAARWYRSYYLDRPASMRGLCLEQIAAYEAAARPEGTGQR
jgi:CDP-glucose 4,6-dehydratase